MPMIPWLSLLLAVLVAGHAAALPLDAQPSHEHSARDLPACTSLAKRVNWNTLSTEQKNSYFDAVKCLKTKPPQSGIDTSKTLYDDFVAIHIQQNHYIHSNAAFLPWHRRFVQARERALQSCGYTAPTPYWDWTEAADTGTPEVDSIFSITNGFGGNGDPNHNQTVIDGPFGNFTVDMTLHEGGGDTPFYGPHYLRRNFEDNPFLVGMFNSTAVAKAQVMANFSDYHYYLEGGPHGAVHQWIGGDMAPTSSPNEPLFFLHHCQVDRLWSLWQDKDPSKRLSDYYGNRPGANAKSGPFDAKLDDMLPTFGNLINQVPVRDVMDTRAGDLCYEVSCEHVTWHLTCAFLLA